MALIHWQPFREIDSLQREMNRLFESLTPTDINKENIGIAFIPPGEIHETIEAFHLKKGSRG